MFDVTSSKLLILGIVALLVIGPKDLPALLRTVGKYMGIIKRHAADFRAQFDEAIRESELSELKKEVESIGKETEASMREAEAGLEKELAEQPRDVDAALTLDTSTPPAPATDDASGPLIESPRPEPAAASPLNGSGAHAEAPAGEDAAPSSPAPDRAPEKSGA